MLRPEPICIATGTAAFPRHSEPTFLEKNDGSLMIAWQEYLSSPRGAEDHAPSRIASMTSTDGGRSWRDHRVLVENHPGDVNVYSSNLLLLGEEILLTVTHNHALDHGQEPITSCAIYRSRDHGATFQPEGYVWKRQPIHSASHVLKRLESGRLILPAVHQRGRLWSATDHLSGRCFYSDDNGATWSSSPEEIDLPMRGVMEPHLAQCRDGRLFMVMRTQLGSPFYSISKDQGQTWSNPQTTGLPSPESCPELLALPGGDLLLFWNHSPYDPQFASHFGKRSPLSVALSQDNGQSWSAPMDLAADPRTVYSNPVAFLTSRGECLVAWFQLPYNEQWRMISPVIDLRGVVFDIAALSPCFSRSLA